MVLAQQAMTIWLSIQMVCSRSLLEAMVSF
jgi:hypothetical protein